MKIAKTTWASVLALTTAVLWVLCAAFVWIFPNLSITISEWWMHGMSLTALGGFNLNLNNFLLGGVTLAAAAWLSGFVFGWSLEVLASPQKNS